MKKLFVATLNTMRQEHFTIVSSKLKNQPVTEKVEPILVQLDVERVSPCFT